MDFRYDIIYTKKAKESIATLRQSDPTAFKKLIKLVDEHMEHPRTGAGKPVLLSGDCAGLWSRRITKKHRLVYEIRDREVVVLVLSAYGHYDDK